MKHLLTALATALALAALWALVFVPWSCANADNRIAFETDAAWNAPRTPASRAIAERHVATLERCIRYLPTTVDCRFILGSNFRLLLRHDDAVRVYREALHYDRRPEVYLNLGMALVEAGRTEEALEPLVLAGVFEPMYITKIYPDEVRMRVDEIVSKRRLLPWHEVLPKEQR